MMKLPVPAGFALVASNLPMKRLREHYGRSESTIKAWCREANVKPRGAKPGPKSTNKPWASPDRPCRDWSQAGQAAEYLRRFGPVYRCNDTGMPSQGGRFWNRGGYILTDADLIARAERLGWDADAWRRVAA
jgi:hypothetical protein